MRTLQSQRQPAMPRSRRCGTKRKPIPSKSILLSDLLKQQSSLADAEGQYHQAVLAYWSARADFQKTLGEE